LAPRDSQHRSGTAAAGRQPVCRRFFTFAHEIPTTFPLRPRPRPDSSARRRPETGNSNTPAHRPPDLHSGGEKRRDTAVPTPGTTRPTGTTGTTPRRSRPQSQQASPGQGPAAECADAAREKFGHPLSATAVTGTQHRRRRYRFGKPRSFVRRGKAAERVRWLSGRGPGVGGGRTVVRRNRIRVTCGPEPPRFPSGPSVRRDAPPDRPDQPTSHARRLTHRPVGPGNASNQETTPGITRRPGATAGASRPRQTRYTAGPFGEGTSSVKTPPVAGWFGEKPARARSGRPAFGPAPGGPRRRSPVAAEKESSISCAASRVLVGAQE